MDFYDITNNAIATGKTQPFDRKKKVRTDKNKKQKSSGAAFVSNLREEIEIEVRAEYESHLTELLFNGKMTSPSPVLSREEYVAQ